MKSLQTQAKGKTPLVTFWRLVFAVIVLLGAYASFIRFTKGLGASTHLSDAFPWGIWIGFDVLVGVGLAAGGFVVSAVVHIFRMERYEGLARPAVLTAFLGYVLVSVALAFDVGQPWRMWHPLVMHNPRSVMFEVAMCVMLYTSVLAIEFSPMVLERLKMNRTLRVVRALYVPFVMLGCLLSLLHQSSLGTMFAIVPDKLHGLWYSSWLPVFFFLTAIAAGVGMTIVESFLSRRAFGHSLNVEVLASAARAIVVLLGVYVVWKFEDLAGRGNLHLVFAFTPESVMFWGEMGLGALLPMTLFAFPRMRNNPNYLFLGAVLTVIGFVVNRLNVSVTGMMGQSGVRYFPSWMELAVTAAFVAVGFGAFSFAVKHFHVFGHGHGQAKPTPNAPAFPQPATANAKSLALLWALVGVGAILLTTASSRQGVAKTLPVAKAAPLPYKGVAPEGVERMDTTGLRLPADYQFPRGKGSEGDVTFRHESHLARYPKSSAVCGLCHNDQGYSMSEKGKPMKGVSAMSRMHGGQLCGNCHNGKSAFPLEYCGACHR